MNIYDTLYRLAAVEELARAYLLQAPLFPHRHGSDVFGTSKVLADYKEW